MSIIKSSLPLRGLARRLGSTSAQQNVTSAHGRWLGADTNGSDNKLLIGGTWEQSRADTFTNINDPSTQYLLSRTPNPTIEEMRRTVDVAQDAFEDWRKSSVLTRQRILMDLSALITSHHEDIAQMIVYVVGMMPVYYNEGLALMARLEQGKTFSDAMGDVTRGLQVVQMASGIPTQILGSNIEVSRDMDTLTRIEPLGVGAAICPFNFPAMIPLWSIAMAIATGNTLILKPSERVPGASAVIAELCAKAGLPAGVLNILHGTRDTVNFLCDEPRIQAISFVGGDRAGKHIYDRAGANGKRVQAQMGAKNHAVLMPDAGSSAVRAVAGAAFGAAGQRCMALSVLVIIGDVDWMPQLKRAAQELVVGNGFDQASDVGPVISPQAKVNIERLIASCEAQGGKIVLDGRGSKVEGYPDGNWVGPTILEATPDMDCYQEEIFGPVLTVVRATSFDEAVALINRNKYGNGSALFTRSAVHARQFEKKIEAGQVGINVPIPVPLPMFSWSGNKGSVLGGASLYGPLGVHFWTKLKTTTTLWREDEDTGRSAVAMPVHD